MVPRFSDTDRPSPFTSVYNRRFRRGALTLGYVPGPEPGSRLYVIILLSHIIYREAAEIFECPRARGLAALAVG